MKRACSSINIIDGNFTCEFHPTFNKQIIYGGKYINSEELQSDLLKP